MSSPKVPGDQDLWNALHRAFYKDVVCWARAQGNKWDANAIASDAIEYVAKRSLVDPPRNSRSAIFSKARLLIRSHSRKEGNQSRLATSKSAAMVFGAMESVTHPDYWMGDREALSEAIKGFLPQCSKWEQGLLHACMEGESIVKAAYPRDRKTAERRLARLLVECRIFLEQRLGNLEELR